jgi:hypothetical protein
MTCPTKKLREKTANFQHWIGLKNHQYETETQVYQNLIRDALKKYFGDEVKKEWSINTAATDAFKHKTVYAPRIDIAVGPFNTKIESFPEMHQEISLFSIVNPFIHKLLKIHKDVKLNQNPRCLLAIEVSFSGSSKHILGDFTNASMMGLIGIVIAGRRNYSKVSRIKNYLKIIKNVGKAPSDLFANLIVYNLEDFLKLLSFNINEAKILSTKK